MPRVYVPPPARSRAPARWATLLLVCMTGCRWISAGNPAPLAPAPAGTQRVVSWCASTCQDSVDVVAMGVDGYLIVPWRDTTRLVMTPPAYSNPSLWHLVLRDWWWGTRPNRERMARGLASAPNASPSRLARVHAVLVGHGHYDHALDLPPLLPMMPDAVVYGSATVRHLLRPVFGTDSVRAARALPAVSSAVGTGADSPGRDLAVGPHLRVRPIRWGHAPNFAGWTIAAGRYTADRRTLPRTVHGWRMGEPLAWTIDILGANGAVAVRLFHHDAAASLDLVRQALAVLRTMPPAAHTVIIMSAANWDQPSAYPGAMLATVEPDLVLFGHWEDFFRAPGARPKVVRGISARELVQEVERYVGPRWSTLEPGATLRLRVGN